MEFPPNLFLDREIDDLEDAAIDPPEGTLNSGTLDDELISDIEAGYDQDEFDDMADSATDPGAPWSEEEVDQLETSQAGRAPASQAKPPKEEKYTPKGVLQLKAMREEGIPEEVIAEWREEREKVLIASGVPEEDIAAFFGDDKPKDQKAFQGFLKKELTEAAEALREPKEGEAPKTEAQIQKAKEAEGFWEAFVSGIQSSATGLFARGKLPEKEIGEDASVLEVLGSGFGQVGAELPIAGAAAVGVGAAFTALAAPAVATGAAAVGTGLFVAGAVPAGIRKFYMEMLSNGEVKGTKDFSDRLFAILKEAGKEGALNVATLGASKLGGKAASKYLGTLASKVGEKAVAQTAEFAAEYGTMAAGPALLEGRLPEKKDFTNAATLMVGFKVASKAATLPGEKIRRMKREAALDPQKANLQKNLMLVTEKTGLHPDAVMQMAAKDSTLHSALIGEPGKFPRQLEQYLPESERPALPSTADYSQIEFSMPEQMELGISGRDGTLEVSKQKTVSTTLDLPEELGGIKTTVELVIPEQLDLGLSGREDLSPLGRDADIDGSMPETQPELRPLSGPDGAGRVKGEQLNLGIDGEIVGFPGQGELALPEGRLFERTAQMNADQLPLLSGETVRSGEPIPDKQLQISPEGGQFQPELGLTYPKGESPKFKPTISAETGVGSAAEASLKSGELSIQQRFESISKEELEAVTKEVAEKHILDIVSDKEKFDKVRDWLTKFERYVVDEYAPVSRLMQQVLNVKSDKELVDAIPALQNTHVLLSTYRGVVGRAVGMFEYGTKDFFTNKVTGKGLKDVLKPLANDEKLSREFQAFAIAARAVDYGKRDLNFGIDPLAAKKIYDLHKDGPIGKIHREFVEYNNRVLKYFKDSGMLSDEQYQAQLASGENYMATVRIIDGEANAFSSGKTLQPKSQKKVKGVSGESPTKIQNVYQSTLEHTMALVEQAERNRVGTSFVNFLSSRAPEFLKYSRDDVGAKTVMADGSIEMRYTQLKSGEIAVYENGVRKIYNVPEAVAIALKSTPPESHGLFVSMLSSAASALRAGATLTPDFIARNGWRDQLHAWRSSTASFGNTYVPWVDWTKGLFEYFKKGEVYQKFLASGGLNSTKTSIDLNYLEKSVGKLQQDTGFMNTARNVIKNPVSAAVAAAEAYRGLTRAEAAVTALRQAGSVAAIPLKPLKAVLDVLRSASETVEMSTRLGQFASKYKYELKNGTDTAAAELLAAYSARNITLDFQRMGMKMQAYNSFVPFFNAKVQGLSRFKKTFEDNPVSALATGALLTTATVYLWAAQKDDPRWDEIPDWQKALFDVILLDDWQPAEAYEQDLPLSRLNEEGKWEYNRGKTLRIPRVQDWAVFPVATLSILESMKKDSPEELDLLAESILGMVPVPEIPHAIKTFTDYRANYNSFTDRAIVPMNAEGLMSHLQYTPYTSPLAKRISQMMYDAGISDAFVPAPSKTDFLFQSMFGGSGRDAANIVSWSLEKFGYTPKNYAQKDWDSLMYVRAFTVRVGEQAESIGDFYKAYREVMAEKKTLKAYEDAGDADAYERHAMRKGSIVSEQISGEATQTQKAMKAIKASVEQIHQIPDSEMTKEEKIRIVDALLWERLRLAREFLNRKKAVESEFDSSAE